MYSGRIKSLHCLYLVFPFLFFSFFFLAAWQKGHTFLVKKNPRSIIRSPVNTANFFGLLVTVLTGSTVSKLAILSRKRLALFSSTPQSILLPPKYSVIVQRHYLDLTGNSKNHCRSTGRKTPQGPLYCKQVSWIQLQKKLQKPCTINLAQRRIQKYRNQSK